MSRNPNPCFARPRLYMAAQAPFAYQRPRYLAVERSNYTSLLDLHSPSEPSVDTLNDINDYLNLKTQLMQELPDNVFQALIALQYNFAVFSQATNHNTNHNNIAAQAPFAYQRPRYLAVERSNYTSLLDLHSPSEPSVDTLNAINNYLKFKTQLRQKIPENVFLALTALDNNFAVYLHATHQNIL
jgi:hypothetical protein